MRARISDDNRLCQSLTELVEVMKKIEVEDARGFRLANILDPDLPTIHPGARFDGVRQIPTAYAALLRECLDSLSADQETHLRPATFLKEVGLRGVSYGISTASTWRNSRLLFESPVPDRPLTAGVIESVFLYSYSSGGTEIEGVFLAVKEMPAITSSLDPYRSFGPFAGFLCREHPSQLRIISSSKVVSHFAWTPINEAPFSNLIHVMPVNRVSSHSQKGCFALT